MEGWYGCDGTCNSVGRTAQNKKGPHRANKALCRPGFVNFDVNTVYLGLVVLVVVLVVFLAFFFAQAAGVV